MSQGQEGDLRPWRRPRKTDYYAAKAASEHKNPTSWPRCEACGMDIKGSVYRGSGSGKYLCMRCFNRSG